MSGVTAEVKNVDVIVLSGESLAKSIGRVRVDPPAVGHKADDPIVLDPVGRPPERPEIRVVQGSSRCGVSPSGVGVSDALVERLVALVLVVVVLAGLPYRIRRVADDDPDVLGLLALPPSPRVYPL